LQTLVEEARVLVPSPDIFSGLTLGDRKITPKEFTRYNHVWEELDRYAQTFIKVLDYNTNSSAGLYSFEIQDKSNHSRATFHDIQYLPDPENLSSMFLLRKRIAAPVLDDLALVKAYCEISNDQDAEFTDQLLTVGGKEAQKHLAGGFAKLAIDFLYEPHSPKDNMLVVAQREDGVSANNIIIASFTPEGLDITRPDSIETTDGDSLGIGQLKVFNRMAGHMIGYMASYSRSLEGRRFKDLAKLEITKDTF
jgi:hypothetical protein